MASSWGMAAGSKAPEEAEVRALVGSLDGGQGRWAQLRAANLLRYVLAGWGARWEMPRPLGEVPREDPVAEGWALTEAAPALFRLLGDPDAPIETRTSALEAMAQLLYTLKRFNRQAASETLRGLGRAGPETLARWLAPPREADSASKYFLHKTLRLLKARWPDCAQDPATGGLLQRLLRHLNRQPELWRLAGQEAVQPNPGFGAIESGDIRDFFPALWDPSAPSMTKGLLTELVNRARTSDFRQGHLHELESFVLGHVDFGAQPAGDAESGRLRRLVEWTEELVGGGFLRLLVHRQRSCFDWPAGAVVERKVDCLSLLLSPVHFSLPVRRQRHQLLRGADETELRRLAASPGLPAHTLAKFTALFAAHDDALPLVSRLPDLILFPN